MDNELNTYTQQAVDGFVYRNGIFRGFWDRWMTAVAFYRSGVDRRGALMAKRRTIRMDAYLERFVDETMDAQVTRNGIFASDSFGARVRRWLRMK